MTTVERLERALSQRLYSLWRDAETETYRIMGSTGTTYAVGVGDGCYCSCPDHRLRNVVCKHICFVLIKVLRLEAGDPRLSCLGLPDDEIRRIVNGLAPLPPPPQRAKARAPAARRDYLGLACAICMDDMQGHENIVYCEWSCGQSVHAECQQRWLLRNSTCVCCRAEWWQT